MEFNLEDAKGLLDKQTTEALEIIQNPSKVDQLLRDLEEKIKKVPVIGETFSTLPVMIAMVKAWITKEYTVVSPKVIACLVGAILYLVTRKDLLPDSIPVVGYADDLAVLGLALKLSEPELKAFAEWRDAREAKA